MANLKDIVNKALIAAVSLYAVGTINSNELRAEGIYNTGDKAFLLTNQDYNTEQKKVVLEANLEEKEQLKNRSAIADILVNHNIRKSYQDVVDNDMNDNELIQLVIQEKGNPYIISIDAKTLGCQVIDKDGIHKTKDCTYDLDNNILNLKWNDKELYLIEDECVLSDKNNRKECVVYTRKDNDKELDLLKTKTKLLKNFWFYNLQETEYAGAEKQ